MDSDEQVLGKKANRLQVLQTATNDPSCETYVFQGEDHTLGNSLRYIIMKNPDVRFCGYTIPHPLENRIHLRIETYGVSCRDVLNKGLKDLQELCHHVLDTFQNEVSAYNDANSGKEEMDST